MKTRSLSTSRWSAVLALALAGSPVLATPVVGFDPGTVDVKAGDSFTLLLRGTGFDATAGGLAIDNVSGGQKLNLAFTPGALEITGITLDPRWSFAGAAKTGVIDNAAGTLTGLGFGAFPATADDTFGIAAITFKALQALPAQVSVTGATLVGRVGNVPGSSIVAGFEPAVVRVSAVPEPESWAMLAAGLGWLALRRRAA